MKQFDFDNLNTLYPVDIDEYQAEALEEVEEHHFTLEGQEVPIIIGSDE